MALFSPADPSDTAASGFANAATGRVYAGRAFTLPTPKDLLPVADDPVLKENFERLKQAVGVGATPELYRILNAFPGGAYFTGRITSASGDNGDVVFKHDLKRIPKWIAWQTDLGGLGGLLQGIPAGGLGAVGGNFHAWTKTEVFVRATVASNYAFVIL